MNYYISLIALFLFSSCVQVAHLTIDGTPVDTTSIVKYEVAPYMEPGFTYEVNPMKNYFSCNADSLEIGYFSRTIEVEIDNPIGQCFGIWFEPRSISDSAKITFKANYDGTDTLSFNAGFTDVNNGTLSSSEQVKMISNNKGFTDYEFTFKNQLTSNKLSLDTANIQTVIIYLNTEETLGHKGLFTVKEIEIN